MKKSILKSLTFLFLSSFLVMGCGDSDDEGSNELTLLEVATNNPNEAIWVARSQMKSRNGESMGYGAILNPNSKKLIIFLDGGGACFNGFTCDKNLDSYSEEDFLNRAAEEKALIINRNSNENQFKDWNFIFVPYATGDVHAGSLSSVDIPDGGPKDQIMKGFNNLTFIFEDLKSYFDTNGGVTEIVFTGSSAGGFGTLCNSLQLGEILAKNIPTTVIVDAGQIFMDETLLTPCLVDKWNSLWGLNSVLPEDMDQIVKKTYSYDIQKIYEYSALKFPDYNFGFLSYYQDETNRGFYSFGQDNCRYFPTSLVTGDAFKSGLIDLKTNVLDDFENWKVFYANGQKHTFLSDENLSQTINGTSLNDWISQLRQGNALDLVE